MISAKISEVGKETLKRMQAIFGELPKEVDAAAKSALKRSAEHLKSESKKEVAKVYDISKRELDANASSNVSYVRDGNDFTAYISFSGQKIPLFKYGGASPKSDENRQAKIVRIMRGGKMVSVHPSFSATGHQMRGTPSASLGNAFTAKMKSGHIGIFRRTGGSQEDWGLPIQEIMGSSFPQMVGNTGVSEELIKGAADTFENRFEHELERIIAGKR